MSGPSSIEWTDATWNPIRGCSRITTGCGGPNHEGGCYAEKIAARFSDPGQPFHGFAERTPNGGRWTGKLALIDSALTAPLHWKKPRRIFVNSMSDLFHENLPDEAIDRVFGIMGRCDDSARAHTFQILTKRAERMRAYMNSPRAYKAWNGPRIATEAWPPRNVWLGVSTERQQEADERIPHLLQTPAAVRFISAEPLLGPIQLHNISGRCDWMPVGHDHFDALHPRNPTHIDWVIVGGESGPSARPMYHGWAQSLRDQCAAAGVPFFFKQWGEHISEAIPGTDVDVSRLPRNQAVTFGDGKTNHTRYTRVGKKSAGRLLDGIEHNAMPLKVRA